MKSEESLRDVEQLGLVAAVASLGYIFWVVGGMEMVERLAYYGVKAVATLYAKAPVSEGGLGITMTQFGTLLMAWALTQSVVPAVTGGLSDRYGYKETIFASTIVKILGYLIMAWFPTFPGFSAGALTLATGTAIFKPGIQGTLVRCTTRKNSSVAWGIFYQTVNIGGFIGPLLAGVMRKMAWHNVFYTCAAVICCNFLLLLTYKEQDKEQRLERDLLVKEGKMERSNLVVDSLQELSKPYVWVYLLIFSGFWFMFNALFDVLPIHISEWVDTHPLVEFLFPNGTSVNPIVNFFIDLSKDKQQILPEGMINIDAGLIMFTCFAFAALSGKMRATTSMVVGTLLSTAALFMCGYSVLGTVTAAAIGLFAIGEMLSSPKFSEFIGNIAPSDKKAMYLGFSQIPLAIGWTLEGKIGPMLYDHFASKEAFAREMLASQGMAPAAIASIKEGEAFSTLVTFTHQTPQMLTQALYASHQVGMVWYIMGSIGVLSALGIYLYGRWIQTLDLVGSDNGVTEPEAVGGVASVARPE